VYRRDDGRGRRGHGAERAGQRRKGLDDEEGREGDGRLEIGSIVITCYEFDRMLAFWRDALGYVPRDPPSPGWCVLRDPLEQRPNVSLNQASTRRSSRSRLHLDLYAADRDREVDRLIALGARRYPWRYRDGADFMVLEDPDGNLFCVVQKGEC
jgi:catechol 2,3-dioxygenase-like lactoylglutathione lyase family enzyme